MATKTAPKLPKSTQPTETGKAVKTAAEQAEEAGLKVKAPHPSVNGFAPEGEVLGNTDGLPMIRFHRRYSDVEKAAAVVLWRTLCGKGSTVETATRQVSDETGIPRRTLRGWFGGNKGYAPRIRPVEESKIQEIVDRTTNDLINTIETRVWNLVEAINTERIDKASLVGVATAAGIMIDKLRLLREQPTQIIGIDNSARESLERKLADIAARNGAPQLRGVPDGPGSTDTDV